MESIFFDVNPSIKQFTENALKANNMLHKAQDREMKHIKSSKTTKAANSNISMESGLSEEDMMSGMEFGDYRGGGASFEFFQSSDEASGEELLKREDDKRNSEMLAALKRSYFNFDESDQKNNGVILKRNKTEYGSGSSSELSEPTSPVFESPLESSSGVLRQGASSDTEETLEIKTTEISAKTDYAKVQDSGDQIKEKSEEQNLDRSISEPSKKQAENVENTGGHKSAWTSLLSFDEGFIIASDDNFFEQVQEIRDEDNISFEEIDIPDAMNVPDKKPEELVKSMLITENLNEYELSALIYYLSSYGTNILTMCKEFGVKISVPVSSDGLYASGAYVKNEKLCVVPRESLTRKEEFVSARFYMALAFDHTLGGEDFSSRNSAAVLSSWRLCKDRTAGHLFQDVFTAGDPALYFAQSVESYLRNENDVAESSFFNKEQLYDYDRTMFSYVDYLFNRMNPVNKEAKERL